MADPSPDPHEGNSEQPPPFWEWVVAGIGAVLLVATLAFLGHQALQPREEAPVPAVTVLGIEQQAAGFVVRLKVRNEARTTAADLRVAGVLRQDGRELERSDTEFQFVPGRSSREGGLFFTRDPRRHALEVRAESYQKP